jgi:hypothetical protein
MNNGGNSIPSSTNLQVGQIWEIDCKKRQNLTPPHIEDVIIGKRTMLSKNNNIENYINANKLKVWDGGIKSLFDGKLGWTGNGSGYIQKNNIPNNSVGFWRADQDLIYDGSGKYIYKGGLLQRSKRVSYKGVDKPLNIIPQGVLIRVSLARWWHPPNSNMEDRCYLQLSGWY